jgi:hypothetical protein
MKDSPNVPGDVAARDGAVRVRFMPWWMAAAILVVLGVAVLGGAWIVHLCAPGVFEQGTSPLLIKAMGWVVLLGGAALGAWALAVAYRLLTWRWRRWKPRRCSNCKYDLTGNVTGVCSECGNPLISPAGEHERRVERGARWLAVIAAITCGVAALVLGSSVAMGFGTTVDSLATLLFIVAVAVAGVAARQAYRAARGIRSFSAGQTCLRFGYDLTGNRSGACSECGHAIDGVEHAALLGDTDAGREV